MKKLMQYVLMAMFLFPVTASQLKAGEINSLNSERTGNMGKNSSEVETIARLKAIKLKVKSNLTKEERKSLRDEVMSIREKHRGPGGAIYISTGGLILIIVLLIILL